MQCQLIFSRMNIFKEPGGPSQHGDTKDLFLLWALEIGKEQEPDLFPVVALERTTNSNFSVSKFDKAKHSQQQNTQNVFPDI